MACHSGNNIIRDGLVLHLDMASANSFRGEPTVNLAYNSNGTENIDIYRVTGASLTLVVLIPDSKWQLTNNDVSGTCTVRIRYADGILLSGQPYTTSFKYKTTSGVGRIRVGDWSDTTVSRTIEDKGEYMYEYATGTRTTHDTIYRFTDLYLDANTTIEIWDIQLEQRTYPTPFVNGTRGSTVATGGGWRDLSGNNNHGELQNSPKYLADNKGVFEFDGVDDYISFPQNLIVSNESFTLGMWLNLTTDESRGGFFQRKSTSPFCGIALGKGGSNDIYSSLTDSSGVALTISIPQSLGEWVRYDVSFDHISKTLTLYKNGISQGTSTNASFNNNLDENTHDLPTLMKRPVASYVSGKMGIFQIYDHALTADEILKHYRFTRRRYIS